VIAAVHAETSTGVRSDIAALGRLKGEALLIVDAVTSIGGIDLRTDDWGVDVGYAGSQKCLGVAPGLAPFTINDRAFDRRIERPRSWYLDLGLLGGYVGEASTKHAGRTYHHTAPTGMIASMHGALSRILAEGLDHVIARHEEAGRILQEGLVDLGLELFAADGYRLPELTTVKVPDGVDSATVRKDLLTRHNIEIGAGVGRYADSVWRIGLMGHNARPDTALLMVAALKDCLGR
jgi:alanine-glyoxylate transaminase/serine-glyoxylate transaminase/serine-pyruvate transaminase